MNSSTMEDLSANVQDPEHHIMVIANRIQRAIHRVPSCGIDISPEKESFDTWFQLEVVSSPLPHPYFMNVTRRWQTRIREILSKKEGVRIPYVAAAALAYTPTLEEEEEEGANTFIDYLSMEDFQNQPLPADTAVVLEYCQYVDLGDDRLEELTDKVWWTKYPIRGNTPEPRECRWRYLAVFSWDTTHMTMKSCSWNTTKTSPSVQGALWSKYGKRDYQ